MVRGNPFLRTYKRILRVMRIPWGFWEIPGYFRVIYIQTYEFIYRRDWGWYKASFTGTVSRVDKSRTIEKTTAEMLQNCYRLLDEIDLGNLVRYLVDGSMVTTFNSCSLKGFIDHISETYHVHFFPSSVTSGSIYLLWHEALLRTWRIPFRKWFITMVSKSPK